MADEFNFPTLKDLFDSYPAERAKAAVKDWFNKQAAGKNEQMIDMHEDNKKHFGYGGLEEITPETSPEDAQKIASAREHLERMASVSDNVPMVGGVGNVPNAAETILAARAAGKTVSVLPEATNFGKVIIPQGTETAAQAYQNYGKVKKMLGK